jgi:(1->4)-alpha-D-glucan 1-alpha-D-glucosylmutase
MTVAPSRAIPRIATYRLQFSPSFGFRDALELLPYLQGLGVSHIYASPIARATPGSRHGYDVCDPQHPNPDLGSREELLTLLWAVRDHNMGWLQDIVPNHLSFSPHNPYLQDVLTFGSRSRWAFLFDIDWDHVDFPDRVLLPILAEPYGRMLRSGALHFAWGGRGPCLAYGNHRLPLSPGSVVALLIQAGVARDLTRILAAVDAEDDPQRREVLFSTALASDPRERMAAASVLAAITDPEAIDRLLVSQVWQLAWWRTGRDVIGYRRFFAVDELIAVRIEEPKAFDLMHALTFDLHDLGLIEGVRVDHIDGLRDPSSYLTKLRRRLPRAWILVEKILAEGERLPDGWPVDGTTGYDTINCLTRVCCDPSAEDRFTTLHGRITGAPADPTQLANGLRRQFERLGLGGDFERVTAVMHDTRGIHPAVRDLSRRAIREALAMLLSHFPVYRTYVNAAGASQQDIATLATARRLALQDAADLAPAIDAVATLLEEGMADDPHPTVYEALMRVQQLSGPVMAKGWEDTFFYTWSRCLALNEVGGDPRIFGRSPDELMRDAVVRLAGESLNPTSTHDTKRGEDTRARLTALTWYAEAWEEAVTGWMEEDRASRAQLPSAEDRYMLYQTLVGTWPKDGVGDEGYRERLHACAEKSVREAGIHTSWISPDSAYESALHAWLESRLDPRRSPGFHAGMTALIGLIARHAAALGVVQTVLKCTLPGVPDIYQGGEWHDYSLVDPDNRRPVDFQARMAALATVSASGPPGDILDPRTKQALLKRCLQLRRDNPGLWRKGGLQAVSVVGDHGGVFAFARTAERAVALVVVRVRPDPPTSSTEIALDPAWRGYRWRDVLTGQAHAPTTTLGLDRLLTHLPCAVLVPERTSRST